MIWKTGTLAGLCAVMAAVGLGPVPARAATGDSGEAKLTQETIGDFAAFQTPRKAQPPAAFAIQGASGSLSIGGKQVAVAALPNGSFGVDVAGAGKVDPAKMVKPDANGIVTFAILPLGAQSEVYPVIFSSLRVVMTADNKVAGITGWAFSGSWRKGTINGVPIRLIDDNLDGKFSQDGQDAIIIGDGIFAMPLMKVHQIGDAHYELKVAADGAGVSFTKVSDLKMGLIETPLLKTPAVQAVMLADANSGRSYDLVASKDGVPAGNYKLVYGMVATGKEPLAFLPTDKTPVYPIQAGVINVLRLGPPLRVDFRAAYGQADGNILVAPDIAILGKGCERYDVDFHGTARPQVVMLEGPKLLSMEGMEFG